jgi:hypothetical protein
VVSKPIFNVARLVEATLQQFGGLLTHAGCLNAVASTGIFRSRLPVAAKIALATAGTLCVVPLTLIAKAMVPSPSGY